jgi:DNA-binding XRE family transcriptional regulator
MSRNGSRSPKTRKMVRKLKRVIRYVETTREVMTAGSRYVAFGAAIREARQRARLRQEDIGKKVGLTRTSIVNIECGRQRVYLDDLFIFAKALDVTPRKLFSKLEG